MTQYGIADGRVALETARFQARRSGRPRYIYYERGLHIITNRKPKAKAHWTIGPKGWRFTAADGTRG